MVQRYLDNIKPLDDKNYQGLNVKINDIFKEQILEDVYKYEFSSLYANLLVKFYRRGYLPNVDESIINRVSKYLENPDTVEKGWVIRLYISELSGQTTFLFDLYGQYMRQFYEEIFKSGDIVYIDTDFFITRKEIDISEIMLDHTKTEVTYFWMSGRKRYIMYENGIKTMGLKQGSEALLSVEGLIKKRIRTKKLSSILD